MKRRLLAAWLLLILLLSGCGNPALPAAEETFEYTFTDSTDTSITLKKRPHKVAVLFSSYAEIWTLAGGNVSVTVGESIERGFSADDAVLVDDGAGKTVDHELLLASQPDLIIGSSDIAAHRQTREILSDTGIPCALFRTDTFDEYLSMLKICTDITGNTAAYETHGIAVKKEIDTLLKAVKDSGAAPKNILFIRAGSSASATKAKRAPDHFVCIMLDELGCRNIADGSEVLPDGLSTEDILLADPDHIFLTTMGSESAAIQYIEDLFQQEGWRDLSAVKNKNYTFLSKDLFHFKPNAQWAEAYTVLAHILYPERKLYGQTK